MGELSDNAKSVLNLAKNFAARSGSLIDSMHILIALTCLEKCHARDILSRLGFTEEIARSYLITVMGGAQTDDAQPSPMFYKILEYAVNFAKNSECQVTDTEHILLAVCYYRQSLAGKILLRHSIDYSTILSIINGMAYNRKIAEKKPEKGEKQDKAPEKTVRETLDEELKDNGVDLTMLAREGKLDPVIGREKEINRLIRILSRRNKNNPIIIGEPGVGKTAIVEGLAQRIVRGEVPENLKDKIIYSLNVNNLISGTRYRGELEEKIKRIISLIKEKNIILFVDEMHTVMSAGSSEGGLNIGNILKPELVNGSFCTIGATTVSEYRKFIERDPAFERRFNIINVGEPTEESALAILKGLKGEFETHHNIEITDEALEYAVKLSARYISDRYLPDKAIDILDEACSNKRNLYGEAGRGILTKEDIKDIIVDITGIPIKDLSENESVRLSDMESILNKQIIGQEEAVKVISKAIKRARAGLKDPSRPVGNFLFLGPTGVGKTETAKALSTFLFGSENSLIRFDMSEYMEKISASRLIGAPPGYVGYDEGGALTEAVRRKPYSVLLFDEIEKADTEVFNILLQVMDDGRLTDGKGRTVDFKNVVIIMTSNIGTHEASEKKTVGFNDNMRSEDDEKDIQLGALKHAMRPEFLNRLDNIVVFNKLSKENVVSIAKIQIERLKESLLSERNIEIKIDEEVIRYLAEISYDEEYGARPLKRTIEKELEDKLSDEIIHNDLRNTVVKVDINDRKINFGFTGGKI